MHGQPPLWNAVLGLVLQVFPSHWPQAWHWRSSALGLVAHGLALRAAAPLASGRRPRSRCAAAFSLTPAVLLYENELFYDYPTLVFLTARRSRSAASSGARRSAAALLVFAGSPARSSFPGRSSRSGGCSILLGVLLVACSGHRRAILLAARAAGGARRRGLRRRTSRCTASPRLPPGPGWGSRGWPCWALPLAERRRLVAEGKLHPRLAREAARAARAVHRRRRPSRPADGDPRARRGVRPPVPAQPRRTRRTSGSRGSTGRTTSGSSGTGPAPTLRAVGRGLEDFFTSPTVAWQHQGDAAEIDGYDHAVDRIVYGQGATGKVGLVVVAAYAVALGFGLWVAVSRLRPGADAADVTIAFAALTILYVAARRQPRGGRRELPLPARRRPARRRPRRRRRAAARQRGARRQHDDQRARPALLVALAEQEADVAGLRRLVRHEARRRTAAPPDGGVVRGMVAAPVVGRLRRQHPPGPQPTASAARSASDTTIRSRVSKVIRVATK